ncbi:MAG: hypothetical protein ACK55I_48385 [bacterium]
MRRGMWRNGCRNARRVQHRQHVAKVNSRVHGRQLNQRKLKTYAWLRRILTQNGLALRDHCHDTLKLLLRVCCT